MIGPSEENRDECTPQEMNFFISLASMLNDLQLAGLLHVAAHAIAHRQGRYDHLMMDVEVNRPDEEEAAPPDLIVLPGKKDAKKK